MDAIVHVIRCFRDDDVIHVSGSVDPSRDIEIINLELALSDLNQIEKRRTRLKKQISTIKEAKLEDDVLEKLCEALENENAVRSVSLTDEEKKLIKPLGLLPEKPIIYATNLGEDELAKGNSFSEEVLSLIHISEPTRPY